MPCYVYLDDRDNSIHEIIQTMSEKHVAFAADGYELKRVFTVANSSIDTKIDPFSQKEFVDRTSKKVGNLGNIQDLAAECSQKRSEKLGTKDPVREKYYENYSKIRKGAAHPDVKRRELKEKLKQSGQFDLA